MRIPFLVLTLTFPEESGEQSLRRFLKTSEISSPYSLISKEFFNSPSFLYLYLIPV